MAREWREAGPRVSTSPGDAASRARGRAPAAPDGDAIPSPAGRIQTAHPGPAGSRAQASHLRRTPELEDELARYRSFIQLSDAAIWCFEFEPPIPVTIGMDAGIELAAERGRLVDCNDTLARMYGYTTSNELIGRPLHSFLEDNPRNLDYLRTFWRQGFRLDDGETEEPHRDGSTRYFLNNLIGIFEGQALKQVWGTQRDITERRLLEAQLLEAQRMEAIGQLAGGIAHDFNNMLMVIAGNLGVVLEQSALEPEDEDALQEALRAADRAAELTRQLLTFSRRTLVRREPVDLASVVHSTFRMLRRVVQEGIQFEFDVDASAPPVYADRSELEQMVINLVVNARDAMPDGGRLRVSLRTQIDEDAPWVVLALSDTGTGMHPETRARIFEPFFTSKERSTGTGLGLSVVYGIVKRCGGSIEAESDVGRGTTFVIRLPASTDVPSPGRAESVPENASRRRATVLLLEDRRDVLMLIRRFLETSGHRVLSADHPDAAFELARSHRGTLDVLLCDVVIPGANGAEVAKRLLEISPQTRVILMSGYADLPDLAPHFSERAHFMTKPFSRSELEDQIQRALASTRTEPA